MTSSSSANAAVNWDSLDGELARWLRVRTSLRAARDRDDSPLDGVAMGLRRVRATLASVASGAAEGDAALSALVSRAYRWSIRIARELEAIERANGDAFADWSRFEAFAPFGLAFYESVLAGAFAAAPASNEVARLRRETDAVRSPLGTAMTSWAMAA
jgi:hypothetical protein